MHSKILEDILTEGAKELGKNLSRKEIHKFLLYKDELKEWNKKFNLTAITRDEEIITKHFLDSLLLIKAFNFSTESIIDIGTGAGFPGIPLKITLPNLKLTLLESVKKKVNFLDHIKNTLSLKDIDIIHGRAEEIGKELRESFDIVVSRAVAPLNTLAEYSLPLIKIGGNFLALKEEKVADEIKVAEKAFNILGGKLNKALKLKLPGTEIIRSIIVVDKVAKTPLKYPRRAGMPKKRPL